MKPKDQEEEEHKEDPL